jgi:GT2 family glycosyltransferase
VTPASYTPRFLETPDPDALIERLTFAPPVTLVVPVYNGGVPVGNSLSEIVRNASADCRIIFADDGSTDRNVLRVLERLESDPRVRVDRRPENIGYTRNVNAAINDAGRDDIILLNSDAQPGPMFVQRMRWTLYGADDIGTVSAVSDNAATHSLPFAGAPYGVDWDSVARSFASEMRPWAMTTPAAHGFCLMISRGLLDSIGLFDADAFPRGYNEELDFALRAARAGWSNVVTPRVMVKHLRSRSFGLQERDELIRGTRSVIHRRYPGWHDQIEDWLFSPEWNEILANSARVRRSIRCHHPRAALGLRSEAYRVAVRTFLDGRAESGETTADQFDIARVMELLGIPVRYTDAPQPSTTHPRSSPVPVG